MVVDVPVGRRPLRVLPNAVVKPCGTSKIAVRPHLILIVKGDVAVVLERVRGRIEPRDLVELRVHADIHLLALVEVEVGEDVVLQRADKRSCLTAIDVELAVPHPEDGVVNRSYAVVAVDADVVRDALDAERVRRSDELHRVEGRVGENKDLSLRLHGLYNDAAVAEPQIARRVGRRRRPVEGILLRTEADQEGVVYRYPALVGPKADDVAVAIRDQDLGGMRRRGRV